MDRYRRSSKPSFSMPTGTPPPSSGHRARDQPKRSRARRRAVIAFWWIWLAIFVDNTAHLIEEKGFRYMLDYVWFGVAITIGTLLGSFWRDHRHRQRKQREQ